MTCARAPSLDDKLRVLSAPKTYAPTLQQVEVKHTHMSCLFLTDTTVYKLKKPVATPYLDFRTLHARAANCRDELILNRRLAPEVYLGLSALVRNERQDLALVDATQLTAQQEVVEWLVRMRRLPQHLTLEHALRHGGCSPAQVQAVGQVLARFYRALPPCGWSGAEHRAGLKKQHVLNAEFLRQSQFGLNAVQLQRVLEALERGFDTLSALMDARAAAGRVVEGHGDLRPEHVFLTEPPVLIDGLEFNRALRVVDWVDEIAFLTLECTVLGAPEVGLALRAQLEGALNDVVPEALFQFYFALRACVRARLALAHLLEPEAQAPDVKAHDKWLRAGHVYLDLAAAAISRLCASARWPAPEAARR